MAQGRAATLQARGQIVGLDRLAAYARAKTQEILRLHAPQARRNPGETDARARRTTRDARGCDRNHEHRALRSLTAYSFQDFSMAQKPDSAGNGNKPWHQPGK